MNTGFWACGALFIIFAVIGILFAAFKEKAAGFVSGFNTLPVKEQMLYDKSRISRDMRNQCFTWSSVMLVGTVLSCIITPYMAVVAYAVWLVLLLRNVRFDAHKAFEKYLLK